MARLDGDSEGQWICAVDGISDPADIDGGDQRSTERRSPLKFREQVEAGLRSDVCTHPDDALYFRGRICVPQGEIRQRILAESHSSAYSIHPGGIKMYQDLKQHFWWNATKREITQYVTKCLVCQQVKAETPETCWITTAFANTRMEVGASYNRFCHRSTPQSKGKQCSMGSC